MGIAQRAGMFAAETEAIGKQTAEADHNVGAVETLLLFAAGNFKRVAVPLSKVARLEELSPKVVERATGSLVIQYRGQILPLLPLIEILDPTALYEVPEEKLQVIVFTRNDGSAVGVIVDRIIDIVQEHVTVRRAVKGRGLLGSAVVGKAVTDLLDVKSIVEATDGQDGSKWDGDTDLTALSNMFGGINDLYGKSLAPIEG
jgi:two-component system, chemotaxis family, sensor kinase CheA